MRVANGFAFIDLLIAIGLVAILIQLTLPIVNLSRENARQSNCQHNLQSIVAGVLAHESVQGHLPTGGWSWQWIGDPNRGFGQEQPGGWIFNVLPYAGAREVHEYSVAASDVERQVKAAIMLGLGPPIFNCPSRRPAIPYSGSPIDAALNADHADLYMRSDYAANGGDVYTTLWPGPTSYEHEQSDGYAWPTDHEAATGVIYCRSKVRAADISRGLKHTYLVGEKYLSPHHYDNGFDEGDDFSMYQGDDMDIARWTMPTITHEYKKLVDFPNLPRRDTATFTSMYAFGSAHRHVWNASFCDGSIRRIAYSIAPRIHKSNGKRSVVHP